MITHAEVSTRGKAHTEEEEWKMYEVMHSARAKAVNWIHGFEFVWPTHLFFMWLPIMLWWHILTNMYLFYSTLGFLFWLAWSVAAASADIYIQMSVQVVSHVPISFINQAVLALHYTSHPDAQTVLTLVLSWPVMPAGRGALRRRRGREGLVALFTTNGLHYLITLVDYAGVLGN